MTRTSCLSARLWSNLFSEMVARILMVIVFLGTTASVGYFTYAQLGAEVTCELCHRVVHDDTASRIRLEDGAELETCCPGCGLRFRNERADVVSVAVTDFDTGEQLGPREAIFVEHSSVNPCRESGETRASLGKMTGEDRAGDPFRLDGDRCLPGVRSVIAFKDREAAEAFRRDYGGVIRTYGELLEQEL